MKKSKAESPGGFRVFVKVLIVAMLCHGEEGAAADEKGLASDAKNPAAVADTNETPTNNAVKASSKTSQKSASEKKLEVPEVQVRGKRVKIISPLPGLMMDRSMSTTNVQGATSKELEESKATNVTEFMNSTLQSVSVNDYSGNPFQQQLNFRGFAASPSIGTPQGLSVYLDGVRINESFGDVVNWDLIPMNALQSLDLIPGSNPLFGLNTLGGALALRTKNGFTDNHFRAETLAGSWGRKQFEVSNGFNNGTFGFFTAYNHFTEDGWRDNSPSNVRQLFNVATLKFDHAELNLSALNAQSSLVGNGLEPFETLENDRTAVYTAPDTTQNKLRHYNLNGTVDINDNVSFSAMAYRRNSNQNTLSGDTYLDYQGLVAIDPDYAAFNGVLNTTTVQQEANGGALQLSWLTDKHQIVGGLTVDINKDQYTQYQQLAKIDAKHNVSVSNNDPVAGPSGTDPLIAAYTPILSNNVQGTSTTHSIFFNDTFTPVDTLQISYGARYNRTNVSNSIQSDVHQSLYNFTPFAFQPRFFRCRTSGLFGRFNCSSGDYTYTSFNPSIGATWEMKNDMTWYGNISRGARTPTVVELGCARDHTKNTSLGGTNYQFGCSIPTSMTDDPYLKQVRSTSYETGLRGGNEQLKWSLGLFRTELSDDIVFEALGYKNLGVYDNVGNTLRQGIEMAMEGEVGRSKYSASYTYMQATYQSPFTITNASNSSNAQPTYPIGTINTQPFVNVRPGDHIPGIPDNVFRASWNYRWTDRFDSTLSMVAHSSAYVRGNDNNEASQRAATGRNGDIYDFIGAGKTPGYTVLNLRANYKFDHGITLFAKVDNLLNKTYSTAGDLALNPFDAAGKFQTDTNNWKNTTLLGPGAPRALWVGLSYDFDWGKGSSKSGEVSDRD